MINTYFFTNSLDSPIAMATALFIGFFFGLVLEQAGFGSSKRLTGVFYFRDMAVIKVMLTAVIVSMIGLFFLKSFGFINIENVYHMPTVLAPQIIGGILFGIGFVMSGWCPGTGAVGLASGRVDALLFLFGAVFGSILFNETYDLIKPLMTIGNIGVSFIYNAIGIKEAVFVALFTILAIAAFWGSEILEQKKGVGGKYLDSRFFKIFSIMLIFGAFAALTVNGDKENYQPNRASEIAILEGIEEAKDHIEPEELANRIMEGDETLHLFDLRYPEEFAVFNIRGAVNTTLKDLPSAVLPYRNHGIIVLYSNGMTHPAQARDSLFRMGYRNVYFLTDGLAGFIDACLKPASLNSEPLSAADADKIKTWRSFFLN